MHFMVKIDGNVNIWDKQDNTSPFYRSSSTIYWIIRKYEWGARELNMIIDELFFLWLDEQIPG